MTRSRDTVTIGIPVRNGEHWLPEVFGAVRSQKVDRDVELLVVDSGSRDASVGIAREHGADVIEIAPELFSHGGTRNLLMERSEGAHVAFLTQDSAPADEHWLARLLAGFELAGDVALVCGPYLPRPGASAPVRRELREFFDSFSADGRVRIDRGEPPAYPGPVTFFSSANGCVAREAWERVPFRDVRYTEDQLLARDMLAAGFSKVFDPAAAVVHSHEYGPVAQFRRSFDEWRGLREVHGWIEPFTPRQTTRRIVREVAADRALLRNEGAQGVRLGRAVIHSVRHHTVRSIGAAAGSRADRLPPAVRRWCSLERRSSFEPAP